MTSWVSRSRATCSAVERTSASAWRVSESPADARTATIGSSPQSSPPSSEPSSALSSALSLETRWAWASARASVCSIQAGSLTIASYPAASSGGRSRIPGTSSSGGVPAHGPRGSGSGRASGAIRGAFVVARPGRVREVG